MAKKRKNKYRSDAKVRQTAVVQDQKVEEFNPDYSDVIKDLKRIGTLAGIFFVVLVALAFVLG